MEITSLTPRREREPGVGGPQVEPVRLRVDLEERAVLGAGGDERLDVEVVALALADQAAGRVPDDVDARDARRPPAAAS